MRAATRARDFEMSSTVRDGTSPNIHRLIESTNRGDSQDLTARYRVICDARVVVSRSLRCWNANG